MKLNELFLAELDREAALNRKVLERVPEGRDDWKPHEKSMPLGYLATLVATMPAWIAMMIDQDSFDMRPVDGPKYQPPEAHNPAEWIAALESSLAKGRTSLSATTDEHLMKPWQFKVAGRVIDEKPRHIMIRDAVLSHLAHHRGQLTVYLRLVGSRVPAIYGPSADEGI
jgi:uncharacterized damage-inducible protein DinB